MRAKCQLQSDDIIATNEMRVLLFWAIFFFQKLITSIQLHGRAPLTFEIQCMKYFYLLVYVCRTKDTLATGNYLSVINILMQLRKVSPDN